MNKQRQPQQGAAAAAAASHSFAASATPAAAAQHSISRQQGAAAAAATIAGHAQADVDAFPLPAPYQERADVHSSLIPAADQVECLALRRAAQSVGTAKVREHAARRAQCL